MRSLLAAIDGDVLGMQSTLRGMTSQERIALLSAVNSIETAIHHIEGFERNV